MQLSHPGEDLPKPLQEPTPADQSPGRSQLAARADGSRTVEVVVMSPEEADHAVAEFWVAGEQLGQTLLREGKVVLYINPRSDQQPWSVVAQDLHDALARARKLLGGS